MNIRSASSACSSKIIIYASCCAYMLLFASMWISDALLAHPDFSLLRIILAYIADALLLPFPNNLFPLIYGITNSWMLAMLLVGLANGIFFYMVCHCMQAWNVKSWLGAIIGYVVLSLGSYAVANYIFFSFYFMRPS